VPHLLLLTTIVIIEVSMIMDITMGNITNMIHIENMNAGMSENGDPGMLIIVLNTEKFGNCQRGM